MLGHVSLVLRDRSGQEIGIQESWWNGRVRRHETAQGHGRGVCRQRQVVS